MYLALLKGYLKKYDSKKGIMRIIGGDSPQIAALKHFVNEVEANLENVSPHTTLYWHKFLEFLKDFDYHLDFGLEFLNSTHASADVFRQWKMHDDFIEKNNLNNFYNAHFYYLHKYKLKNNSVQYFWKLPEPNRSFVSVPETRAVESLEEQCLKRIAETEIITGRQFDRKKLPMSLKEKLDEKYNQFLAIASRPNRNEPRGHDDVLGRKFFRSLYFSYKKFFQDDDEQLSFFRSELERIYSDRVDQFPLAGSREHEIICVFYVMAVILEILKVNSSHQLLHLCWAIEIISKRDLPYQERGDSNFHALQALLVKFKDAIELSITITKWSINVIDNDDSNGFRVVSNIIGKLLYIKNLILSINTQHNNSMARQENTDNVVDGDAGDNAGVIDGVFSMMNSFSKSNNQLQIIRTREVSAGCLRSLIPEIINSYNHYADKVNFDLTTPESFIEKWVEAIAVKLEGIDFKLFNNLISKILDISEPEYTGEVLCEWLDFKILKEKNKLLELKNNLNINAAKIASVKPKEILQYILSVLIANDTKAIEKLRENIISNPFSKKAREADESYFKLTGNRLIESHPLLESSGDDYDTLFINIREGSFSIIQTLEFVEHVFSNYPAEISKLTSAIDGALRVEHQKFQHSCPAPTQLSLAM